MVTDFGKMMDAIADKILVNGILIILAYSGMISIAVPVIIILLFQSGLHGNNG